MRACVRACVCGVHAYLRAFVHDERLRAGAISPVVLLFLSRPNSPNLQFVSQFMCYVGAYINLCKHI